LKINLFSPWYSWKIAELALNNNHSLTQARRSDNYQGQRPRWLTLPGLISIVSIDIKRQQLFY